MWATAGAPAGPPSWAVEESADSLRIAALPSMSAAEKEALGRSLVPEYSRLLRRPGSSATLKWPQALGLHYLYEHRGAYLGLPPGVGKTLVTYVAPVVCDSRYPALVAPASLHRDKTPRDFARYGKDWIGHYKGPTLINIEGLSLEQNVNLLQRANDGKGFDLVMIDEGDLLRNPTAAAFVRLDRFRTAFPDAVMCVLTGSGMRWGITDYDTHLNWCLPHGDSPVPYDERERELWRQATQSKSTGRGGYQRRPRAGVLLDLGPLPPLYPGEAPPATELERAQLIVGQRINSAPGVLIIDDDDCDMPIEIRLVLAPEDPIIDADFEKFYGTTIDENDPDGGGMAYCLPNGEPCTDGLAVWRGVRSMGCGYYEYIDPAPPIPWSMARRRHAKRVRGLIEQTAWSADPADTPKAVERYFPNDPDVKEWKRIKPTFDPKKHTKIAKQSESVIDFACQWMRENEGLVWCASKPMAQWIARKAGVRYYGAEGKASDGALIEDARADERAVVSIKANSRGRNLQDRFHTGLVIQAPQSADELHQLFKRYHRFGQTKPVRWDVLVTSGAARYAFDIALFEAHGVKKQRRQVQTILRADITDCILDPSNPRWFRKDAPK